MGELMYDPEKVRERIDLRERQAIELHAEADDLWDTVRTLYDEGYAKANEARRLRHMMDADGLSVPLAPAELP